MENMDEMWNDMENMEENNYTQRDLLLILTPSPPAAAATAAIHTPEQQQQQPPQPPSPAAAAATIALKFHPKHEKQKQNETHYENITH